MLRLVGAVVSVVTLLGCGGPEAAPPPVTDAGAKPPAKAGDVCAGEGSGLCSRTDLALVCESSALREIPCRGTAGCIASATNWACDNLTNILAGDGCARTQEGKAACSNTFAAAYFVCLDGGYVGKTCPTKCYTAMGDGGGTYTYCQ